MKQLVGRKIGMTRIFDGAGREISVTVVEVQPHVVIGHRTAEKNGYDAVIVGVEEDSKRRAPRQIAGQYPENVSPRKFIREIKLESTPEIGSTVDASVFSVGDRVKVVGTSKGRGFAGFVKRHHFKGGPNTHGSMSHRLPGSIGSSAYPSRVIKGVKGAGHQGNQSSTVKGLRVVEVDAERNLLVLSGCVPGWRNGLITISSDDRGKA
ncbi:MAG: 50S ribosomal protein L3 [Candidatus Latescibacteria bacterium ADurb.Bin168]|nr:MAG: 50S ribosomal protein L3 [Candidatus Latescibacteria bacterium ADurb.Bin168]